MHLIQAGKPLAVVRKAVRTNIVLRELLTTPLSSVFVTLAYAGKDAKDLPQIGEQQSNSSRSLPITSKGCSTSPENHRSYLRRHLHHTLVWLAQQMQRRNQSIFYLERLQVDWLPTEQTQRFISG